MLALTRHCANFVRRYGIVASLRELGPFLKELLFRSEARAEASDGFDRQRGTDTSGIVMPWELSDGAAAPIDSNPYASLTSGEIRALLGAAPLVPGETTFVDVGSGKGRVLLVAQDFPFRKIIGVEWSGELIATARSNLARIAEGRDPDNRVEIMQQDAAEYSFPADPLVVFFFNPFGETTMARVVENLEHSLAAVPRPVFVIYANPQYAALFKRSGAFRPVSTSRAHVLFESRPA